MVSKPCILSIRHVRRGGIRGTPNRTPLVILKVFRSAFRRRLCGSFWGLAYILLSMVFRESGCARAEFRTAVIHTKHVDDYEVGNLINLNRNVAITGLARKLVRISCQR